MNDKNKAIEEMAKTLCKLKRKCEDCKFENLCIHRECAKELYNAGYRKVDEIEKMKFYREAYEQGKFDANAEIAVGEKVVVSRAEYEALQSDLINTEMNLQHITKEYEQTRKETARKILQVVNQLCKEQVDRFSHLCKTKKEAREETCRYEGVLAVKNRLGKIAEKYGVEVE